jgi:hypothetical protein
MPRPADCELHAKIAAMALATIAATAGGEEPVIAAFAGA